MVNPDFSIPGYAEIFVVGDTALIKTADGSPVPGLAPAAVQAGKYAASVIIAREHQTPAPPTFAYKHLGTMATIGRGKAVASLKHSEFGGLIAWLLWSLVHLMPLVGFRNRLVVAGDWVWAYITKARGVRLITVSGVTADNEI